jgi:hypothetical protein
MISYDLPFRIIFRFNIAILIFTRDKKRKGNNQKNPGNL